jgi:circadian clock protein KaiC
MLSEIIDAIHRLKARRVVIDSLSGFELALAPTFREDFRESLYRMLGSLTALGVTVMATVELTDTYTDFRFSPQDVSFLTDAVIIQRYYETEGQLKRLMSVVKVRASQHSKELREYEISAEGLCIMPGSLRQYDGLLSGRPRRGT